MPFQSRLTSNVTRRAAHKRIVFAGNVTGAPNSNSFVTSYVTLARPVSDRAIIVLLSWRQESSLVTSFSPSTVILQTEQGESQSYTYQLYGTAGSFGPTTSGAAYSFDRCSFTRARLSVGFPGDHGITQYAVTVYEIFGFQYPNRNAALVGVDWPLPSIPGDYRIVSSSETGFGTNVISYNDTSTNQKFHRVPVAAFVQFTATYNPIQGVSNFGGATNWAPQVGGSLNGLIYANGLYTAGGSNIIRLGTETLRADAITNGRVTDRHLRIIPIY